MVKALADTSVKNASLYNVLPYRPREGSQILSSHCVEMIQCLFGYPMVVLK